MFSLVPFSRSLSHTPSFFGDDMFRSFMNYRDVCGGFCVDVREEGDCYELTAEVPGVQKEQIDLSVEQDVLTITVEREERRQDEKSLYAERRYGRASRSFSLEGIDQEGISAHCRNGVLTVRLPKSQEEKQKGKKQIDIQE